MTYGQVAAAAGRPGAARGVVWILHSSSGSARLPWHRVVGARGRILLREGSGWEVQRAALEREGVRLGPSGAVDLAVFGHRRASRGGGGRRR